MTLGNISHLSQAELEVRFRGVRFWRELQGPIPLAVRNESHLTELSIMVNHVAPPTLTPQHRDRGLACQEALEPCFSACVKAADKSGWTGEEAAFALLHLSLGHLKAYRTNLAISEATRLLTIAAARP